MSNIDKYALREAAERALPAMKRLLMMPNDELFDEALLNVDGDVDAANAFNLLTGPETVLALLDELEAKDKSISFLKDQLAQLANFNPDWDKLEAATDSLREHMAELTAARKRIAELEATQGKPVMFIDGDISPADAEKLAAVIREFNEETETPAARMARIIRENPHPTNMCDMPVAAAGKGEAS